MPPRTMIAGAFACTLTMSALAQDYPSRSITMMISFSAGSSIDVAGRIVAARLAADIAALANVIRRLNEGCCCSCHTPPLDTNLEADGGSQELAPHIGVNIDGNRYRACELHRRETQTTLSESFASAVPMRKLPFA